MTNIAAEDIMQDIYETFDADYRDGFNGRNTVEQINEAAHFLGIITEPEYQRNRIALEKLAF